MNGKRGEGPRALPSLRLRVPLVALHALKTRDGPTAICTVPQAASRAAALVPLPTSARVGGRVAEKWRAAWNSHTPKTRSAGERRAEMRGDQPRAPRQVPLIYN